MDWITEEKNPEGEFPPDVFRLVDEHIYVRKGTVIDNLYIERDTLRKQLESMEHNNRVFQHRGDSLQDKLAIAVETLKYLDGYYNMTMGEFNEEFGESEYNDVATEKIPSCALSKIQGDENE